MSWIEFTLRIFIAAFVADWVIQSNFIGMAKNRHTNINKDVNFWPYALTAHALTQAVVIGWASQMLLLGIVEFFAHWVIDFFKCEGKTNLYQDQALHLICCLFYSIGYGLYCYFK